MRHERVTHHFFFDALLIFHKTSLLPDILAALAKTMFTGHYHYMKMLVDNANSIGANTPVENQSAKEHLIPALKARKVENPGITIVDTSLAYGKWKGTKYALAFGADLASQVIAHNSKSGQPVEPGIASSPNSANDAATSTNNPAGADAASLGGAGSAAQVAAVLASLGPEFMAQFLIVSKEKPLRKQ